MRPGTDHDNMCFCIYKNCNNTIIGEIIIGVHNLMCTTAVPFPASLWWILGMGKDQEYYTVSQTQCLHICIYIPYPGYSSHYHTGNLGTS